MVQQIAIGANTELIAQQLGALGPNSCKELDGCFEKRFHGFKSKRAVAKRFNAFLRIAIFTSIPCCEFF